MGSAVGAAYRAAGQRVVTTVSGRSERTGRLAELAGLERLPDLDSVVAEAELVLSIVPPDQAVATAAEIAAAAARTGSRPLVGDWNAVAPATVRAIGHSLAEVGLELRRRLDLRRAAECGLPHARLPVGDRGGGAHGSRPALGWTCASWATRSGSRPR